MTKKFDIERWRQPGSAGFFAWVEDTKPMIPSEDGGFQPYEVPNERVRAAIIEALDGDYSTVVFCWPKRHGKTVISALIITWRFLTRKTQSVAIVANSEKQSVDTGFHLVKSCLEETPFSKAMVDKGQIRVFRDRIDYPALKNWIQGYPANAKVLHGKKLSIAQVSELHAARSDAVYQVCASQTIDSSDGIVLVDSTTGAMSSPLYGLWKLAEAGEDPALFFSYIEYRDLEDAIANSPPWISPIRLRSRAAQMTPAEFGAMHLNSWQASSARLFPEEILEACRDSYALDPEAIVQGAAYVVGGGLDRAYGMSKHGDATVCTAVLKTTIAEEEHFFVLASDSIALSMGMLIKRTLNRYRDDWQMKRAALEHYNAQDISAWCAEQGFAHEIVSPTLDRQSNAFNALYGAAAEGRLHIHESFEKLLAEMVTFEHEVVQTNDGRMVAKFSHAKGCHDDHVYSLAWAIYAIREFVLNPYELNGINCDARKHVAAQCILNGGSLIPLCSQECRSYQKFANLYKYYEENTNSTKYSQAQFFEKKVINIGHHSILR